MQSPHPPRPPYPPRPGSGSGGSDRELVARLGGTTPDAHAVALLMARHWRAAHDYAAICLASSADSASMAAAAAFHRVLERAGAGAVRPQLLAAVRDTVKEWAADDVITVVLPELRKPTGGRGLRAARSLTPERRQLAERAFRALPGASQCLLWHTEVEAETLSVTGALLGVDATTAAAALERAREEFRTGCVRAHRELAPTRECRFYNRLLDIPIRRGGDLLPDVQRHMAVCRHCRHAAEQLSHFDGGLEVLLAETVLGWGARRYLDSRPGRAHDHETRPARPTARPRSGGRHRPGPTGPLAPARRRTKAVLVGASVTALALLATVLVTRSWSEGDGEPGPDTSWGMVSGNSVSPGSPDGSSAPGPPPSATADDPVEVGRGRLRNTGADLCLDLRGGRPDEGIRTVLARCASAGSQQWSYKDDGLLRSVTYPTRCLDADADNDAVVLADCVVHAGEVRYDLTVRGELLLRRGGGLLVARGPERTVVVADRNGSAGQRWVLETGSGRHGSTREEVLPGIGLKGGGPPPPSEQPKSAPASAAANSPRGATAAPESDQSPPAGPRAPAGHSETRFAQVGGCAKTASACGPGAARPTVSVLGVGLGGAAVRPAGPRGLPVTR
ncbi:ricin-type beta-trefoil lectin domain protein [Streptomyces sp. NPDC005263]|uniref:ricin-type beta-trefoil lectin domain protein n=1 Tax=Streptomyces sp. NPDC005263 TaxID=3364711 RepID=UPI0036B70E02